MNTNNEKRKEYLKEYYQKNKEKIKEYEKEYSEKNKERIAKRRKEYRIKNKERLNQYSKEYREKNKEKIKEYTEKNKERRKEYRMKNKERFKQYNKEYNEKNKERRKEDRIKNKEWRKEYLLKNKERIARLQKELITKYRKTNIQFKLSDRLRSRLHHALKGNIKNGSAVRDLGCTLEELKIHLENQFEEGMTWDNWKKDGWHIDHIKPLNSFDLTDPVQLKEVCHYTNLQPLWAYDNISKGDKIDWEREFNV